MADFLIKAIASELASLKHLGLPSNFYLGTRPLSFDVPVNVLIWLREKEDRASLDSFHYRHILCFNISSPGQAIVDHRIHDFRPGHGLLIFPFQFHHFITPANTLRQWIYIGFEMKNSKFLEPYKNKSFALTPCMTEPLTRLLRAYVQEAKGKRTQNRTPLFLALLLNEMGGSRNIDSAVKTTGTLPSLQETLSARVQRYVHTHLNENIRINGIAHYMGMSASRLRARYRQELGISLGRTLQAMRFTRSQELLTVSTMNVSEIADACGYESVYAFSLAFKKKYGVSPLNFRKQLR
ncbi:MAG: AraC family transcriptional regulator [Fibrobacterota bacterium]